MTVTAASSLTSPTASALSERSLGDLARSIPGATALFRQAGLDFCCGGRQSLGAAVAERRLDAAALLGALQALQDRPAAEERDWREASANELIDHLLTRFHQRHREQLPELLRLAQRVESVHGDRSDCPRGLADHLETMMRELDSHMAKEEQILFPLLRVGSPAFVTGPIEVMRQEHDDHGAALARLASLTDGLRTPADACNTWRALYAGLQVLRDDLMEHIHLENNILFEGAAVGGAQGKPQAQAPAASRGGCGGGCCGGCGGDVG